MTIENRGQGTFRRGSDSPRCVARSTGVGRADARNIRPADRCRDQRPPAARLGPVRDRLLRAGHGLDPAGLALDGHARHGPDDKAGPGGWVHNLDHGYVVALYRCAEGTCPSEADLASLRDFAANGPPSQSAAACGYRSKVFVARFDDMSTPYALLAWDRALLMDTFDATAARTFAGRFVEATAPEPNAC